MAELTISASDIAQAISKNLEGYEPSLEARTVGRVVAVGETEFEGLDQDVNVVGREVAHLFEVKVFQEPQSLA